MKRAKSAALAMVIGGLAVISCRSSPGASGAPSFTGRPATTSGLPTTTTTRLTLPAPVPVTLDSVVLNLVDRSRQTVSHGRLIASTRTLRTTVWFAHGPATSHPLIVFAHGYSVGVAPYVRVCQAWARAGFVVAAPSFPLTDASVAGQALDEADMVNQPADVSFVISALVSANRAPGDPLNARIDPQRVAVAGHSDGADTALAVTYLPQDRDPRIRAAVVDAPDPLPLPAGAARLTSTVPLLLLHGDGDAIAPYAGSLRVLTQLTTPGWFITLRGADHLSPIKGPSSWTAAFDRVTTDFFAHAFGDPAVLNATLAIDAIGSPVTVQKIG